MSDMNKTSRELAPITLDDLPRHSAWPKRLLSLEAFAVRQKTEREVLREFQDEKWSDLLRQVRSMADPTLDEVERAHLDLDSVSPCYDSGSFYLASQRHMLERHLTLYSQVLIDHIEGASCLVELGAGYGSKLLALSRRREFSGLPLLAGEYTQCGRDLIALLAQSMGKSVQVGHCDFRKMKIEGISIPEDAVIFTSYAVHYVPKLSVNFIRFLSRSKPRAVIHFEPCYEHYDLESLHGIMCRRYVELNDYTRNLVTVVEAGRERAGISVRMRKNVFGSNPFLPISVIEWAPAGRSRVLA